MSGKTFKLVFMVLFFSLIAITPVAAIPNITDITDNTNTYVNRQIPSYDKLEISFQLYNSTAVNYFFPYDSQPPPGLTPGSGVSVDATFTDPSGNTYNQPAFYYQHFDDQIKNNREWFYPSSNFSWKVRFSPHLPGNWKYKLVARDAGGVVQSAEFSFVVVNSANRGFVKVSTRNTRYFEYDDGSYFPALGFNLNGGTLDNVNPVLGNQDKFRIMGANGIQLTRVWISQFSIFGEAYGKWGSSNRVHLTQEPRYGIVHPLNSILTSTFASKYPGTNPPSLPLGSEYYLWMEFDKTQTADGSYPRFTPCRYFTNIPVKQNTNYRIKVRYTTANLEGPLDNTRPFGFAIKRSSGELATPLDACNSPVQTAVQTIAASYNSQQVAVDPVNPGWKYLEGTYNSGANDFFGYLYLTFDNVVSADSDLTAGQIFIDQVWLEEAACSSHCPNLIHKPEMDMHTYINQRDAYSFDKVLDLARQNNIYLKAVMMEKNDRILQTIDYEGRPVANQSTEYFYGDGTSVTKVRWLQQAWWRYLQARWGFSPHIHSWELLNEGSAATSHYQQADEFGKFLHCRVFGQQPVVDPVVGAVCRFDHPNSHLVTTSFYGSVFPWQFWNNGGSAAAYKLYRDIDYADQHYYANIDDTGNLASYYDSALFSYKLSTAANFSPATRKPLMRGETAWNPPASSVFESNADGGEWLHDFIWAGINHGGLMEHFFAGGNFTNQIYNLRSSAPHDHRPMFNTFYQFIKDIPLNNGYYQDAAARATTGGLRAWGQKDPVNHRAHLWIANQNHTWKSVVDRTNIFPISGQIVLSGFPAGQSFKIDWWNTYQGQLSRTETVAGAADGTISLTVANLITDIAVKIYPAGSITSTPLSSPSPTVLAGDANGDRRVDGLDYIIWVNHYGTTVSNGAADGDFNSDNRVEGIDYVIWINNYGH